MKLGPNNAKWRADENTTASVENMQLLMETFTSGNNIGSLEAYQELGNALNAELNTLIRQCTMTGDSHDALHKFLNPISKDIEILKGTNLEASSAAQMRLEEQLSVYQTFFE